MTTEHDATEDELKDKAQASALAAGGPQPGEIWKHYKGGLYVIVCRSMREDTHVPLVTYRSNLNGYFWTRTLANFTEQVPGLLVSRFERFFLTNEGEA